MATPAATLQILVDAQTRTASTQLAKLDRQLTGIDKTTATATTRTSQLGKASKTAGSSLGRAARAAGGAALAYLSISQAKSAVTTTQDLAKSTLGLVGNLGFAEKAAGEWSAAARARGVDTQKLGMGFKTLSSQVEGAMSGVATSEKLFKDLGISMQELKAGQTDVPGLMLDIAEGTDKAGAGTERLNTISKLFGRSYQGIAPLIRDGSDALEENLRTTEKYGSALHGKVLKEQAKLRAETIESTQAWQGLQVTFTEAVTPALIKMHNQFQRISKIMADDKLTSTEKWEKVGNIMSKWGDKAFNAFIAVLPKMIEKAGQAAPRIVGAIFEGFKNADWNAKLWLFAALGGKLALGAVGRSAGLAMGGPWGVALAASMTSALAGAEWEKGVDKGVSALKTADFSEHIASEFDITLKKAQKVEEWMSKHPGVGVSDAVGMINPATKKARASVEKLSTDSVSRSREMGKGVSGNVSNMVDAVAGGYNRLKGNTNKALAAFEAKTLDFKIDLQKHGSEGSGFARGGPIGGSGTGDKVPAMLEAGEYVMNRKAVAGVGKASLDAINFGKFSRFQQGGQAGGLDFALGPYSIPPIQYAADHAGGNSHVHVTGTTTPWVVALGHKLQQLGFMVGEHPAFGGVGGGHSATGGHYDALAIDINSAANETRSEVGQIAGLLGGGGGFGVAEKIKRLVLSGKGPLRDMGQAGLDKVRAAANKFISKQTPMGIAPTGGGGGGVFDNAGLASLWTSVNKGLWDPRMAAAIAMGESSGNPRAIGHDPGGSTGYGLWQITDPFNRDLIQKYGGISAMLQPIPNAKAAGDVFRRQGSGAWYAPPRFANGGVVGSYATGGEVNRTGLARVHRGETITPAGKAKVEVHLHGSMDAVLDEVDVLIDGRKAEIADYTLREGGRSRSRARQLGGRNA